MPPKAVPQPPIGKNAGLPSGLIPNRKKKGKAASSDDKKKAFLKNKLKSGGF